MKVAFYTLGCKVNQYESRALLELLEKEGFERTSRGADVCVINTCAVTAESERKGRQTIRRAVRENPGAYVLVTGCAVQVDPDAYAGMENVHFVSGNRQKKKLAELILDYAKSRSMTQGADVSDLCRLGYERMEVSSSERTRAYMKIEDGCSCKCAYCIIPRARGPVCSRSMEDCLQDAKRLTRAGYREIVLTGIEVSAYGEDLQNTDLTDLIAALESVEGLERIRLSSIDPSFFRPETVEKLRASTKLAHHFHLSLQSGCDKTLAAMRRKYNAALVRRNIGALRAAFPDVRFTADVIVGFPGESEEDFEETLAFMRSLEGMLHVHVFAYSRRPQTEADAMPGQLPESVKSERSARLIALCEENERKTLEKETGKTVSVLFESAKGGEAVGHTGNFVEVRVKTKERLNGKTLPVFLCKAENGYVEGILRNEK